MHFAETVQLHIFKRPNVARHELFYTTSEYDLMILVVREDVLAARAAMALRDSGEDDMFAIAIESVCVLEIEHLLVRICERNICMSGSRND